MSPGAMEGWDVRYLDEGEQPDEDEEEDDQNMLLTQIYSDIILSIKRMSLASVALIKTCFLKERLGLELFQIGI